MPEENSSDPKTVDPDTKVPLGNDESGDDNATPNPTGTGEGDNPLNTNVKQRFRRDFAFKVATVKWFGLLSGVAIISMIILGFFFIDRMVTASAPPASTVDFKTILNAQVNGELVVLGLEQDGLGMRNKRALAALYMRAYTQFLAIIGGTVLSLLGAVFVLARVDSESSNASGGWGAFKVSASSSSPGVMIAFVGAVLIGTVVWLSSSRPIVVADAPIFLKHSGLGSVSSAAKDKAQAEYKKLRENSLRELRLEAEK